MNENLCPSCEISPQCREPFPMDECDNYSRKVSDREILELYHGMSKTMQKSVYEIMKITQGRKEIEQ